LEPRQLLTTLYWIQGGTGEWVSSASDQNWNTASDGSGSWEDWTDGVDAYIDGSSSPNITLSSDVSANTLIVDGCYSTINARGSNITLTGDDSNIGGLDFYGGTVINHGDMSVGSTGFANIYNDGTMSIGGGMSGDSFTNDGTVTFGDGYFTGM